MLSSFFLLSSFYFLVDKSLFVFLPLLFLHLYFLFHVIFFPIEQTYLHTDIPLYSISVTSFSRFVSFTSSSFPSDPSCKFFRFPPGPSLLLVSFECLKTRCRDGECAVHSCRFNILLHELCTQVMSELKILKLRKTNVHRLYLCSRCSGWSKNACLVLFSVLILASIYVYVFLPLSCNAHRKEYSVRVYLSLIRSFIIITSRTKIKQRKSYAVLRST